MRQLQSPTKSNNPLFKSPMGMKKTSQHQQTNNSNSIKRMKSFKSQEQLPDDLPLRAKLSMQQQTQNLINRAKSAERTNSLSSPRAPNRQSQKTQQKAYTYQNQDTYIGQWLYDQQQKKQKPNGYGCYKFKKQLLQYRGYFTNGMFHGTGTLHKLLTKGKPQIIYEGQWAHGEKHGTGKYYYGQGSYYEGNWVRNQKQGQGIYKSLQGEYNGQWVADMKHGNGTKTLINGTVYSGQWQEDTFLSGEIKYPNGDLYKGQVNEQYQPHLSGEYMIATGEQKYKGTWRNGKKEGQGQIMYVMNGERYSGGMRGDKREGQNCTYEWKNGSRAVCSFENNFPVRGRLFLADRTEFEFDMNQGR